VQDSIRVAALISVSTRPLSYKLVGFKQST
jgi:hypothetical protein